MGLCWSYLEIYLSNCLRLLQYLLISKLPNFILLLFYLLNIFRHLLQDILVIYYQ